MRFLDANVLVSAAVEQDASQHERALRLILRIRDSDEDVFIPDVVLTEVAANLQSTRLGSMSKLAIRNFLMPLLQLSNVHVADKATLSRVFDVYVRHSIDLTDAYLVVGMQDAAATELYSFDTDFDRIRGVTRLEP